jgi:hypothetical protein
VLTRASAGFPCFRHPFGMCVQEGRHEPGELGADYGRVRRRFPTWVRGHQRCPMLAARRASQVSSLPFADSSFTVLVLTGCGSTLHSARWDGTILCCVHTIAARPRCTERHSSAATSWPAASLQYTSPSWERSSPAILALMWTSCPKQCGTTQLSSSTTRSARAATAAAVAVTCV